MTRKRKMKPNGHFPHDPVPPDRAVIHIQDQFAEGEMTDDGSGLQLTRNQARFVSALLTSKSIAEAGRMCGISTKTYYRWKSENPDFVKAINSLSTISLDQARINMDQLMEKAAGKMDEALDATQIEHCPRCRQALSCGNCGADVVLNNWPAVLKATEMLLKRQGELVNRTETKVEGKVIHEQQALSHAERVAAAMYSAGLNIPPDVEASLRAKNALPEKGSASTADAPLPDSVDAEYRDVTPPTT